MLGAIDAQFMDVPPEVLIVSMKVHLRFFTTSGADGKLANRFVLVANNVARDGGKTIVAGNERVLRGRLADAKFFWDQDRKITLESRVPGLEKIVFHAKLGTQAQRVDRIVALAAEIAKSIDGADAAAVAQAARLCKADLVTGMVGEFPELQGVMGATMRWARSCRPPSPTRSATITRRPDPTTAAPRRRFRSRSRWPTSSMRLPLSGRSARSRRARAIPSRCVARRSA